MIAFANPWGLLGLLALPAVVWLHLYRVRFPPLAVGGLFLWDDAVRRPAGGRTRDRLKPTASLWLELLATLLLGLLLGDPRVNWETTAPHLVAVLDGSASMGATVSSGAEPDQTFRSAALDVLANRARRLGGDTVLTVIETGDRPRVIGGPRRPWRAALADLSRDAPPNPRHGFAASLDLAARLAADGGSVLLLTDRDPAGLELPGGVAAVSVGALRANAALLSADRGPAADGTGGEEVFVRVRSFGETGPVTVRLGDAGGRELARRVLPNDGGSGTASFPLPAPESNRPVRVELTAADDALAADSAADLLPPPVRPVRVANALTPGAAREAVGRALAAVPGVEPADPDAADLLFAAEFADAAGWLVRVGPLPGDVRDAAGPFLLDRADPLTAGVSLAGTIWGGAGAATTAALPGEPGPIALSPVIAAGDRVLLGRIAGRPGRFALNVDPARGTLARTPDWPILVSNLVEARRAALPGLDRANLRVGEPATLVLPEERAAATGPLSLERVGGEERIPLAGEPAVTVRPPGVGVWAVRDGPGGAELGRVSVRLADAREADLTRLASGSVEPDGPDAAGTVLDDPAPWPVALLAVGCLLAVVADWWVTRRS